MHADTCATSEVELVAQLLCEVWSVWVQDCSLAPLKWVCLALVARQGGFQEVLHKVPDEATHITRVHKPHIAQLAWWKAQPGNSSLPGLSAAADTFYIAYICSVHLGMQSPQRPSASQRLHWQSNLLMRECPSLAPFSCIQQLYS